MSPVARTRAPSSRAGRLSEMSNEPEADSLQPDATIETRELEPYGWDPRWADLLAAYPGATPGRVTRHDGSAVQLATPEGVVVAPLVRRLDPAPAVGDWVAC